MLLNSGRDMSLEKFRQMHSEIIENYQCIEYDMRRIYSSMRDFNEDIDEDYDECMERVEELNWGTILKMLESEDKRDGEPYFTDEEYAMLDDMRNQRNFWCHQCYLEWVYIADDRKRSAALERMLRRLENEGNRAAKIQKKMERYFIEDFA